MIELTEEEKKEFQVVEDYLEALIESKMVNDHMMRSGSEYGDARMEDAKLEMARMGLFKLLKG